MSLRVVLFAPTPRSLYSRLLVELIQREQGVEMVGIAVRSMWSWRRIRAELRRDGARLIRKVYNKLLLGEKAYPSDESETLPRLAEQVGLADKTLRQMAARSGIPFIQKPDLNGPLVEAFLIELEPDVVVFSGGGLVREQILEIPSMGIINCHSGVLPLYRGMDVVEWAVLEAQEEPAIGLTLHFMDQGVDTGPILMHAHEQIRSGDTLGRIRRRMEPKMVDLMVRGLRGLSSKSLNAQPQVREEGRQYYVMHPELKLAAATKVAQLAARR